MSLQNTEKIDLVDQHVQEEKSENSSKTVETIDTIDNFSKILENEDKTNNENIKSSSEDSNLLSDSLINTIDNNFLQKEIATEINNEDLNSNKPEDNKKFDESTLEKKVDLLSENLEEKKSIPNNEELEENKDTVNLNKENQVEEINSENKESNDINVNNQETENEDQINLINDQNNQNFISVDEEMLNNTLNHQQIILQQTQNPETGELLVVLQGENGEQIAIPPEAISNGFVQIRDSEGNEQIIALALPQEDETGNSLTDQSLLRSTENNSNDQIFIHQQQSLEVSADILNTLGAANIAIPTHQLNSTTASTNVVQSLETPRVSTQETSLCSVETNSFHKESKMYKNDDVFKLNEIDSKLNSSVNDNNLQDLNNEKIINADESINNVTLDSIVANASLISENQEQNSYVIMTADDNLSLCNLPNQITNNNQTFYLETPEGLVACSTATNENGTFQILTGDISDQNQYVIHNEMSENQLIETVNENGQPITFTIASNNNNEIELLPVNNSQSSLIDLKNNMKVESNKNNLNKFNKLRKQKHFLHEIEGGTLLLPASETTIKPISVSSSSLNSNKRQNVSIIQNINHQNNHYQFNNPLSRKRTQKTAFNVTVTPSNSKSSLSSASKNEDFNVKKFFNSSYSYNTTFNKQDSNQLSSSRKTYSRKNIVWLNPKQNETSDNISKTNSTEIIKNDSQLKTNQNDNVSVTITPIKETNNEIQSQQSLSEKHILTKKQIMLDKPSPNQIKKGTITISTIIDKSNKNSNVYNNVKIVPSDSQSRLLKNNLNLSSSNVSTNLSSVETNKSEMNNKNNLDIKKSLNVCLSSNKKGNQELLTDSKNLNKRIRKESLTEKNQELTKNENSNLNEKQKSIDLNGKNDFIKNETKKQLVENMKEPEKSETGRRKSPIKPIQDCESNFEDGNIDKIPISFEKNLQFSELKSDLREKKEEKFKNLDLIKNTESKNLKEMSKTKNDQRSDNEEDTHSAKRRRSGRISTMSNSEKSKNFKANDSETDMDNSEGEHQNFFQHNKKRGRPKRKTEFDFHENLNKDSIYTKIVSNKDNQSKNSNKSIKDSDQNFFRDEDTEKKKKPRVDEDSLKFDLIFNSNNKFLNQNTETISDEIKEKKKSLSSPKNDILNQVDHSFLDSKHGSSDISVSQETSSLNEEKSLNDWKSFSLDTVDKIGFDKKSNNQKNFKDKVLVEDKEKKRRKTISSILDLRNDDEFYDIKSDFCEMHIRQQFPSPKSIIKNTSGNNYMCQKCGYKTNRMNNLVFHHKDECQAVKTQMMMLWESEIKKQTKTSNIISKKKRILDSQWDLLNNDNKTDYSSENLNSEEDDDLIKKSLDKKYDFEENEIVWVNIDDENIKWPALVQKIYSFNDKASIILIDNPIETASKTIYSIDEIITFNDADQNIKFLNEGKIKFNELIITAVQKAEDYTRKKILGEELDISKLLGSTSLNSSEKLLITENNLVSSVNKNDHKIENSSILKFIKNGKTETHLLGIYKETIYSKRHENFKNKIKNSNTYGFFDDEDGKEEIFEYCLDLFKTNFNKEKKEDFDVVSYMFDVWIPESIIKSVSRYLRVDMEEAENIFINKKKSLNLSINQH